LDTLYQQLEAFLTSLGRDVHVEQKKKYFGFWHDVRHRRRVFAYVHVGQHSIDIDVRLELPVQAGFVSVHIGKVCKRRITLRGANDLKRAEELLRDCSQNG
jgi:hypothetical protein